MAGGSGHASRTSPAHAFAATCVVGKNSHKQDPSVRGHTYMPCLATDQPIGREGFSREKGSASISVPDICFMSKEITLDKINHRYFKLSTV